MKISSTTHVGILLLLPWFASFSAAAGNWKRVADDKKVRVEIEVTTLARDGNNVKAWERETYHKPEQAKPGDFFFSSVKTLAQHHCTGRTTTYLFRSYFAADGSEIKTIATEPDLGKVDFLVPDSLEERKLAFACAYAARKTPQPVPVQADNTTESPDAAAKPAPAKTAGKAPAKDEPAAKTAGKSDKAPDEPKPEKAPATKPAAITPPSAALSGKTPPGK